MVNLKVGEGIRFVLTTVAEAFRGIGILLKDLGGQVWKTQVVTKDGCLGDIVEVPEWSMLGLTMEEGVNLQSQQAGFINGLKQAEYRSFNLGKAQQGSKKKSHSNKARWAGIEAQKANGTWKPKQKPPKQGKGKNNSESKDKKKK